MTAMPGLRRHPGACWCDCCSCAGLGAVRRRCGHGHRVQFPSREQVRGAPRLRHAPPAELQSYTIEKPARIAIDFPGTRSALERKRYSLPYGNATGVLVLESGDRTRLILNLVKLVPYDTRVDGNSLYLTVGQDADAEYYKQESDPNTLATSIEPVMRRASRRSVICNSSAPVTARAA
jgi:type IV pilus assembly protein PilQ